MGGKVIEMKECPWCHVDIVKEKVEGNTTFYRCPKCKRGFTSTVFGVPVKDLLEGKEVVLSVGKKTTFWSRLRRILFGYFR